MCSQASNSTIYQIISDPKALTTLIAAAITLVIAICSFLMNYFLFHARKKEQRKYESEYEFYRVTVLSSINELSGFANEMKKCYVDLNIKIKGKTNVERREIVEQYSDLIEVKYNSILYGVLPPIKGYSETLETEIETIVERLFDAATDIFSKYAISNTNADKDYRCRTKLSEEMTSYIRSLFFQIRNYRPGTGK
jgi:cbb3-type cytochrome oxidase subunit 3